jgi:HEAT repeat protein
MKRDIAKSILLMLACVGSLEAQTTITSADAFRRADFDSKKNSLRAIILHESPGSPADIASIVRAAMIDSDARVREGGVAAVFSHAASYRIDPKSGMTNWLADRQAFQELRPDVIAALADPSENVRFEAASALASLDETPTPSVPRLKPETVKILVERFYADSSVKVRSRIASGLAGDRTATSDVVLKMIRAALQDPNVGVRTAAASGAWKLGADGPALLVRQLTEVVPNARLRAAVELGKLGPEAQSQLPAVEEAIKRERDIEVRKQLQRTAIAIGQSR